MTRSQFILSIAAAVSMVGAIGAHAAVTIAPGKYVRVGVACLDAPFAEGAEG